MDELNESNDNNEMKNMQESINENISQTSPPEIENNEDVSSEVLVDSLKADTENIPLTINEESIEKAAFIEEKVTADYKNSTDYNDTTDYKDSADFKVTTEFNDSANEKVSDESNLINVLSTSTFVEESNRKPQTAKTETEVLQNSDLKDILDSITLKPDAAEDKTLDFGITINDSELMEDIGNEVNLKNSLPELPLKSITPKRVETTEKNFTEPHLPVISRPHTSDEDLLLELKKESIAQQINQGEQEINERLLKIRENVDAQEEVEEDEEGDDDALLDPNHPLMSRVQDALYKQLSEQNVKLDLDIKEKEESVKKVIKKREDIGVELYSVQQQLARLQSILEGTEQSSSQMIGFKEEAERKKRLLNSRQKEQTDKWNSHNKNLEQHKNELEKMQQTLKQVKLYSDELASKIMVAKRTTLKSEADIIKQEMEKKRQDYHIDNLTEQLRKLQEQRALYETQFVAQQQETKAALETLQDASVEMEAIQYEKRQLLHQWKSSLIGLQRRDEVLEQIKDGIKTNNNQIINLKGEISGFKLMLKKAAEESEALTLLMNKLDGEVNMLKRQINSVNDSKDKLKESYSVFSKSLSQTEQELAQVLQERQVLQLEVNALQKSTQKTMLQTQKLENEINEQLQSQVSIEKGTVGTKKDSKKLFQLVHEKESLIALTQNDLSLVKLDSLNISLRLSQMKENLKKLDNDLSKKNESIEKYELEIRRRNDELGKKQSEMDLLNKKYDQLTGKNQDDSMGPLEATIHNVTKSIEAREKECTQLSQFWIKAQNELVSLSKKSADLTESTKDFKIRLTVLNRKKMVVESHFDTQIKEIRDHQKNIRQLQNEMVRVNTLLYSQASDHNKLEENNLTLELEYRAKLKTAEMESIQMESNIEHIKEEKEKALVGIIEAERQMMLWEKKIQLAKETQAALDPNIGASEIREMTVEIHRMKLRYSSMLKVQEKMISEMEKSVFRRETISIRTKTKGSGGGQFQLQKNIQDITKKIRQTSFDVSECENETRNLKEEIIKCNSQIEEASEICRKLEDKEMELFNKLEEEATKKSLGTGFTLVFQRQCKRFEDVKEKKYQPLFRDPVVRRVELLRQKEKLERIHEILKKLKNEGSPQLQKLFNAVESYAKV
ncbi:Coiled-coil domain-containing protein 40 [Lobulomyces angularis]|nr:Coiled-coil domain-containing protein 40 [Lobulomyces angularis]